MKFSLSLITIVFAGLLGTLTSDALPLERRGPAAVITKCSGGKKLALTFDDGPHLFTYDLATELHDNDVKATFFINGGNYQ